MIVVQVDPRAIAALAALTRDEVAALVGRCSVAVQREAARRVPYRTGPLR